MAKAGKAVRKSEKTVAARGVAATGTAGAGGQRPVEERIRERAYELYLERGGRPGDPLNDWLRAEREVVVAS